MALCTPSLMAIGRAVLGAILATYPFVAFFFHARDVDSFIPCNKPCVYYKLFPTEDMPAVLPISGVVAQNGRKWTLPSDDYGMSLHTSRGVNVPLSEIDQLLPLQCDSDEANTREKCASDTMMSDAVNDMRGSKAGWAFVCFIVTKGAFDFAHDFQLLRQREESAMLASFASFFCLGIASTFAFSFFSNSAELFAAVERGGGVPKCVCLYRLGDLDCLGGLATPLILLVHFTFRYMNLLRAATYGDYLFFWTGNVPYRLLQANFEHGAITSVSDSLLTGEIVGDVAKGGSHEQTWTFLARLVPQWPPASEIPAMLGAMWRARASSRVWRFFAILMIVQELISVSKLIEVVRGRENYVSLATMGVGLLENCLGALIWFMIGSRLTKEGRAGLLMTYWPLYCIRPMANCSAPLLTRGVLYLCDFVGKPLAVTAPHIMLLDNLHLSFFVSITYSIWVLYIYASFARGHKEGARRPILEAEDVVPHETEFQPVSASDD